MRTAAPQNLTPSSRYLELLPDGEVKRRFILDCTGCHQFDAKKIGVEGRLKSESEWRTRTEQMLGFAGANSGFPVIMASRNATETAEWLVAALGDENDPIPEIAPLDIDATEAGEVQFTEFVLPDQADLPHDLELDPQGRPVITGQLTGRMYRLDPASGTFTQYPIPVPDANPRALSIEDDGTWWVLLGGPEKIVRYHPDEDQWRDWDIGMHPHSIVRSDDGRIWFNGHFSKEPEQMGYIDPGTDELKIYDIPTPPMPDGGTTMPYALRMGPDGVMWGTQFLGGRLLKFDPRTEESTLYPLPTSFSGPRRLDVGSDGIVWIPEYAAGKLARFDPQTETFIEYDLPVKDALPYIVRSDVERGWVWIASSSSDVLMRFFPEEERFTVHPYPTPGSLVRHMDLDDETGALWLAYGNFPPKAPKVVKAEVQ